MNHTVMATFLVAPLLIASTQPCHAETNCMCPVLTKDHLLEIYGTGETYDAYRGYIPHTRKKVTREDRSNISGVEFNEAFKAQDGTCTCWYIVRDSNNRKLDELGLEELEPKLSNEEAG